MLQHLRPAIVLIVLFSALTGLLSAGGDRDRPDRHALPGQREPHREGWRRHRVSANLGQWFKSDRYFHPRPSATTDTDPNDSSKTIDAPYNAADSSGSILAPPRKSLSTG